MALALLSAAATAQVADPPAASQAAPVPIEIFKGPRAKDIPLPVYPASERHEGGEGWVVLNFMVDPAGKPIEAVVVDSIGNPAFEKAALQAVNNWTFEPASIGGQPITAGHNFKVVFAMKEPELGARPEFVSAHKKAIKAIAARDRTLADTQIDKLKAHNLYEDAFRNVARYQYFRVWGTEAQQLEALNHAIAAEAKPRYLPKSMFNEVLEASLPLQVILQDFAGALRTWDKIQANGLDEARLARWRPVIEEVKALKRNDAPYALAGTIDTGSSWFINLFKNRFEIRVLEGKVSEVKLRCDKAYVFFRYEAQMQYKVADRLDGCEMEVVGDPGTKFTLIQS